MKNDIAEALQNMNNSDGHDRWTDKEEEWINELIQRKLNEIAQNGPSKQPSTSQNFEKKDL